MKKIIDHNVASSLKQFLQYQAWVDLEACAMVSGQFYSYEDEQRPGKICYGSSYAPWAYDSSLSGQGITIPDSFGGYTRDEFSIDFQNGRLLSTGELPNLTGVYSFPHSQVSFYVSSEPDWSLLDETNYLSQPYMTPATGAIPPYSYVAPCVFVKSQNVTNEPLCLGGEWWSVWNYRISVVCKDEYELTALQKIIRDCKGRIMTMLPETPFNPIGDLKFGEWNYPSFFDRNYYAFIEDSTFRILENDIFVQNHPGIYMGIGTIEVRVPRFPNIPGSDPDLSQVKALTDVEDIFDTDEESDFILS